LKVCGFSNRLTFGEQVISKRLARRAGNRRILEIRQAEVPQYTLILPKTPGQTILTTKAHTVQCSVEYTYLAAPHIYGEVYEL